MDAKLAEITSVKRDISCITGTVSSMQNELENVQQTITTHEDTIQHYSDMYDDITLNNSEMEAKMQKFEQRLKTSKKNS